MGLGLEVKNPQVQLDPWFTWGFLPRATLKYMKWLSGTGSYTAMWFAYVYTPAQAFLCLEISQMSLRQSYREFICNALSFWTHQLIIFNPNPVRLVALPVSAKSSPSSVLRASCWERPRWAKGRTLESQLKCTCLPLRLTQIHLYKSGPRSRSPGVKEDWSSHCGPYSHWHVIDGKYLLWLRTVSNTGE